MDGTGDAGRFSLKLKAGDGYGLVITERVPIPPDSFPSIALENAKKADPKAKITFQEKRKVNGLDVWFLKMEAVVKGIPLSYRGYYYVGKGGGASDYVYECGNGRGSMKPTLWRC